MAEKGPSFRTKTGHVDGVSKRSRDEHLQRHLPTETRLTGANATPMPPHRFIKGELLIATEEYSAEWYFP